MAYKHRDNRRVASTGRRSREKGAKHPKRNWKATRKRHNFSFRGKPLTGFVNPERLEEVETIFRNAETVTNAHEKFADLFGAGVAGEMGLRMDSILSENNLAQFPLETLAENMRRLFLRTTGNKIDLLDWK